MIDVNVSLFQWPFRRLPHDDTASLVQKLQSAGVTQAWVGSFEAILHEDADGVNRRLAEECRTRGAGMLIPFGCVNPTLPDWKEDVRRCREEYGMPGVRLHPNYHGYTLDSELFAELLSACERHQLIVQISARMEDIRTQHPLVQVPDVDLNPLLELLPKYPSLKLVLLNSQRSLRAPLSTQLAETGQVSFDIAMLEGIGGVGKFIREVPYQHVLFGSHFPFFYLESSLLKMKESDLGETIAMAIATGNATPLLATE
ncbi:MAG: amidohydrolase family protein [Planctomycetaceae bacterium]|nr:amidohydrolase family protein [Planctomycetaceae bacterium]